MRIIFGARFHDPEIGMWMSVDPEDEFWNSYVYCGNDPLNLIDPTGSKIEGLNTGDNGTMSSMANAGWFQQLSENAPFLANLMWDSPIKFGKGAIVAATITSVIFNTWGEVSNKNWEALENGDITGLIPIGGSLRSYAVVKAWKAEANLVKNVGIGTRAWSTTEKAELLATGRLKGYVGHHINSVKKNPHLAGNQKNIEFLQKGEHIKRHSGNYRNATNGELIDR